MADETKASKASIIGGLARSFNSALASDIYTALIDFLSGTRSFYILFALGVLTVFVASIGGFDAMRIGYSHAYNISRDIPFGIIISTYIFFVVTSTGLCIIASMGHVFGLKDLIPIANRTVFLAIVTILAGFTVIFFDIENPFRMAIYNAISPNLTSNIWWMGTLYAAEMVFLTIEFILILIGKYRYAIYAGIAGLLSGVAAISNLGAVFGMVNGREYWYGPYLPIYFVASAMASGCAAIIFFTWVGYKVNNEKMDKPMERALEVVSKLAAFMIAVITFFTIWNVITGIVGASGKREVIKVMLVGPFAFNFWVFEIIIGMIIPFVILLGTRFRNVNMSFLASVLMIIGIFITRYDVVVEGQIVPVFYELGVNEYKHLFYYVPSFHEIMIVIGGMGIVASAFLIGERVFKGHKTTGH